MVRAPAAPFANRFTARSNALLDRMAITRLVERLRVARRRRAERFYACGALEQFRAARSTRTFYDQP